MAARFWRCVLGCELFVAAMIAWLCTPARDWPAALALALGLFVAMQFLLVGASLLAARLTGGKTRSGTGYGLRAWVSESLHFLHVQLAMSAPRAGAARRCPPSEPAQRPLLMLHGILCNHAVWRRLGRRLAAAGFAPITAPDFEPLDAGIDDYRACAERELLALHGQCRAPVAIVAHSMGGLVARSLLATLGPEVISGVVTVASPHHGTTLARCLPLAGARQMRPDSEWLAALNAAQEGRFPVPLTSIHGREDNLVVPAQSAVLRGAESCELRGLGHFGLLRSRRSLEAIVNALVRHAGRT
ncbi:MAG TPA: alpha/beta fold hydrolase [Steroidobacteraceae bacterium]|nr:alpha/beta fold hydrolase [Steroidobacteraceae bacterium]